MDERENDETYRAETEENYRASDAELYETAELYEPVEAYAGYNFQNAHTIAHALTCYAMMPVAGALHDTPDHEHGRNGIQFFLFALALLLLMLLVFALGHRLGDRSRRTSMQRELDLAYDRLTQLQLDGDRHALMIQNYANMNTDFRRRLHELSAERLQANQAITAERQEMLVVRSESARYQRGANVMAIMMATQVELIRSLQNRLGLLRGMILNHPCPLGGYILIQMERDGAEWHVDPQCPLLTLNPIFTTTECDHCPHCAARDENLFVEQWQVSSTEKVFDRQHFCRCWQNCGVQMWCRCWTIWNVVEHDRTVASELNWEGLWSSTFLPMLAESRSANAVQMLNNMEQWQVSSTERVFNRQRFCRCWQNCGVQMWCRCWTTWNVVEHDGTVASELNWAGLWSSTFLPMLAELWSANVLQMMLNNMERGGTWWNSGKWAQLRRSLIVNISADVGRIVGCKCVANDVEQYGTWWNMMEQWQVSSTERVFDRQHFCRCWQNCGVQMWCRCWAIWNVVEHDGTVASELNWEELWSSTFLPMLAELWSANVVQMLNNMEHDVTVASELNWEGLWSSTFLPMLAELWSANVVQMLSNMERGGTWWNSGKWAQLRRTFIVNISADVGRIVECKCGANDVEQYGTWWNMMEQWQVSSTEKNFDRQHFCRCWQNCGVQMRCKCWTIWNVVEHDGTVASELNWEGLWSSTFLPMLAELWSANVVQMMNNMERGGTWWNSGKWAQLSRPLIVNISADVGRIVECKCGANVEQ